jgi:hypothetical protein
VQLQDADLRVKRVRVGGSDLGDARLALRLPKISSGQVGKAVGWDGSRISWLLSEGLVCCGMMIGCAASTGLPGCDERVRVTAASSGERP